MAIIQQWGKQFPISEACIKKSAKIFGGNYGITFAQNFQTAKLINLGYEA